MPSLLGGLRHENWRIRQSSVQLLGDLLFSVSGMSGAKTTEGGEDDNFGTEAAREAIIETLGQERRERVLAGVYMARQDVNLTVRQTALHVWKVVVQHTVSTLREILPSLIKAILAALASKLHDEHIAAGRALGELVRKLGERILAEVFPMLEAGLDSDDPAMRRGV